MTSGDEIVGLLEKGLVGYLALGYIVIDKTGLLDKVWALFAKDIETKQKTEDSFQALAFRSVEKSVDEIPARLLTMEQKIESAKQLLEALIDATRSIMAESGVMASKVNFLANQMSELSSKLELILVQIRTCPKKET